MNDPWEVKNVRQPGQYVSCLKINGVPLLPPVLSQECRKEMRYYKLLAREVEKRIALLKPCCLSDTDSDSSKASTPDISENEKILEKNHESLQKELELDIELSGSRNTEKRKDDTPKAFTNSDSSSPSSSETTPKLNSSTVTELVSNISYQQKSNDNLITPIKQSQLDLPERDYNCLTKNEPVTTEVYLQSKIKQDPLNIFDFSLYQNKNPIFNVPKFQQDGPPSLTSKSFTGSLNDIHTEGVKDITNASKLIRQRSYTILQPSPLLLAHLEVQSINTGVEMTSISMSESLSNLYSPKKRKGWDLETAKVKWSSMALELNQKNNNVKPKTLIARPTGRKVMPQTPITRARSVVKERPRRNSLNNQKATVKSDQTAVKSVIKRNISPNRNTQINTILTKDISAQKGKQEDTINSSLKDNKATTSAISETTKAAMSGPNPPTTSTPVKSSYISESDDPATRVRLLYEKIQKQQLLQMATLVEKQKREQLLLQQVFEEQNNLLYKQLKTICPKSPIEAKEAWADNAQEDRGPVSLSQLINQKRVMSTDDSLSSTLTDTNSYIHQCDDVLKKSRTLSNSFKKSSPNNVTTPKSLETNNKSQMNKTKISDSKTKTSYSKAAQLEKRAMKQNCDSSPSDREYEEAILTDRTNDTMADLNFTLTSDDCGNDPFTENNNTCILAKEVGKTTPVHNISNGSRHSVANEETLRNVPASSSLSRNSVYNKKPVKKLFADKTPTPQERAAATRIVAHAKGYLVRRLLKTERVQVTVQMIRDALLCALQLHQDREGIRGADVDLHRRLIQQITAACYTLHDTFVASSPAERCAVIAADRDRRRALASRQSTPTTGRRASTRSTDIMSQSHSGVFPARTKRSSLTPTSMTQSSYETFSNPDKFRPLGRSRYLSSSTELNRRRPWR